MGRSPTSAWIGSSCTANISAYTTKVAPKKVRTICSRRRTMKRNMVRPFLPGRNAVAPRCHMDRGATTCKGKLLGELDLVDVDLLEQVHADVGDLLRVAEHVLAEPEWDDGHVVREDGLGLTPELLGLGRGLGVVALADQVVEGRVAVAVVVRGAV